MLPSVRYARLWEAQLESLATEGNVIFIFELRSKPGRGDELIAAIRKFDFTDDNPMNNDPANLKDGVLCRDPEDPDHFFMIGEWKSATAHREALVRALAQGTPPFFELMDGGFSPSKYLDVVMSAPPGYLTKTA